LPLSSTSTLAGGHGVALVDPPVDDGAGVERLEAGVEPRPAGNHRGFAGDHAGVRACRNEAGVRSGWAVSASPLPTSSSSARVTSRQNLFFQRTRDSDITGSTFNSDMAA
jgi:hypothetical protein